MQLSSHLTAWPSRFCDDVRSHLGRSLFSNRPEAAEAISAQLEKKYPDSETALFVGDKMVTCHNSIFADMFLGIARIEVYGFERLKQPFNTSHGKRYAGGLKSLPDHSGHHVLEVRTARKNFVDVVGQNGLLEEFYSIIQNDGVVPDVRLIEFSGSDIFLRLTDISGFELLMRERLGEKLPGYALFTDHVKPLEVGALVMSGLWPVTVALGDMRVHGAYVGALDGYIHDQAHRVARACVNRQINSLADRVYKLGVQHFQLNHLNNPSVAQSFQNLIELPDVESLQDLVALISRFVTMLTSQYPSERPAVVRFQREVQLIVS